MTTASKRTAAALVGAVALASGAYALGSQGGNGSASAQSPSAAAGPAGGPVAAALAAKPGRGIMRLRGHGFGLHRGFGRDLPALAAKLGVSEPALRSALQDLRPNPPAGGARPGQNELKAFAAALRLPEAQVTAALKKLRDQKRADFASRLASALKLDPAKVQAALQDLRKTAPRPGARPMQTLAFKLGVTPQQLRSALESLRPQGGLGHNPSDLVAALAKELGVDASKVQAAFDKVRSTEQARHQAHEAAFAAALARKLNIPVAKVKDALRSLPDHHGPMGRGGAFKGPAGGPGMDPDHIA